MLTDVGLYLDLNTVEQFLFLKAEPSKDADFIINELLMHFVKNGRSVVLLSTSQTFLHYSNVGLKLGINVKQLRENKQFVCLDVLKSFSGCFESLNNTKPEDKIASCFLQSKPTLISVYESIKQAVEDIIENKNEFLLILDDVMLFLSFGASVGDILDLVHYCRLLVKRYGGCLLVCSCDITDDDDNQQMNAILTHLCDKLIVIQGLNTGHSREIDGKV
ncbi:elongator complex protein 6-like [Centruroides sculpturatus]|uniref:elongator complex protein 6-like n=1 Tax=Centruroides sculpturatus TaxID=218467 RepID=UPI000C6E22A1|nr:elongator complex protein 6-like [Centruroides sculpturatus]